MNMLEEAKSVLDVLIKNGYQAYFVGGYVRDYTAGHVGKDIDIATSAKPDDVCRLFPRTAPTGLSHGTVTVIMPHHVFEVTTFRVESQYEQFRRPQDVQFVDDLILDLQRRDFTMNAMALDREGRLIDPFNGQQDMLDGILRCVGDPRERFSEDALRMLRCIRFAGEYGLEIEEQTWKALLLERDKFAYIAMERIRSEWERMMAGTDPDRSLQLLLDSGLLSRLKVPLPLPAVHWNSSDMPSSLMRIGEITDVTSRWALFMIMQNTSPEQARQSLDRLTFARTSAQAIVGIVKCDKRLREPQDEPFLNELNELDGPSGQSTQLVRRFKYAVVRSGTDSMERWLAIAPLLTDYAGSGSDLSESQHKLLLKNGAKWLAEMPAASIAQLHIRGQDIVKATGIAPGPRIGRLLDRLLLDVAFGKMENEHSILVEKALKYNREWNRDD